MRDILYMIVAFAVLFGTLGYLNAADIENCMDRGNSYEACNRAFNR